MKISIEHGELVIRLDFTEAWCHARASHLALPDEFHVQAQALIRGRQDDERRKIGIGYEAQLGVGQFHGWPGL